MGTDPVLAEHLPVLYRVALDAVDELARHGARSDAARLRVMAGRAYSQAWDDRCRRILEDVVRRAHAGLGREASAVPLSASVPSPIG
jgi:hypothetical protein